MSCMRVMVAIIAVTPVQYQWRWDVKTFLDSTEMRPNSLGLHVAVSCPLTDRQFFHFLLVFSQETLTVRGWILTCKRSLRPSLMRLRITCSCRTLTQMYRTMSLAILNCAEHQDLHSWRNCHTMVVYICNVSPVHNILFLYLYRVHVLCIVTCWVIVCHVILLANYWAWLTQ